jgi:cytochrome c
MVMRLVAPACVLLLVACQLRPTYMPSGEQTYKQYCAACHGVDAKGHGSVASVLTTAPPDLTTQESFRQVSVRLCVERPRIWASALHHHSP